MTEFDYPTPPFSSAETSRFAPEEEHGDVPEIRISAELVERYRRSIAALVERTTRWDPNEKRYVLRDDAPDLFVVPLRSGPIVKTGYDAYCQQYGIPQPPSLVVPGIGRETRDHWNQLMTRQNPQFDTDDDWESDEGQAEFRRWVAANGNSAATEAIAAIRSAVVELPLEADEPVNLIFVDDTGSEYRDVRDRVTPAVLEAAISDRPYQYEYHLMLPQKEGYPDELPWQHLIIRETFGPNMPRVQRDFLDEAIRGSFDYSHESTQLLETEADLRALADKLFAEEQRFQKGVYGNEDAENGFLPLFERYGSGLLQLREKLEAALIAAVEDAPSPRR